MPPQGSPAIADMGSPGNLSVSRAQDTLGKVSPSLQGLALLMQRTLRPRQMRMPDGTTRSLQGNAWAPGNVPLSAETYDEEQQTRADTGVVQDTSMAVRADSLAKWLSELLPGTNPEMTKQLAQRWVGGLQKGMFLVPVLENIPGAAPFAQALKAHVTGVSRPLVEAMRDRGYNKRLQAAGDPHAGTARDPRDAAYLAGYAESSPSQWFNPATRANMVASFYRRGVLDKRLANAKPWTPAPAGTPDQDGDPWKFPDPVGYAPAEAAAAAGREWDFGFRPPAQEKRSAAQVPETQDPGVYLQQMESLLGDFLARTGVQASPEQLSTMFGQIMGRNITPQDLPGLLRSHTALKQYGLDVPTAMGLASQAMTQTGRGTMNLTDDMGQIAQIAEGLEKNYKDNLNGETPLPIDRQKLYTQAAYLHNRMFHTAGNSKVVYTYTALRHCGLDPQQAKQLTLNAARDPRQYQSLWSQYKITPTGALMAATLRSPEAKRITVEHPDLLMPMVSTAIQQANANFGRYLGGSRSAIMLSGDDRALADIQAGKHVDPRAVWNRGGAYAGGDRQLSREQLSQVVANPRSTQAQKQRAM